MEAKILETSIAKLKSDENEKITLMSTKCNFE